jgi:hypothetical protein
MLHVPSRFSNKDLLSGNRCGIFDILRNPVSKAADS